MTACMTGASTHRDCSLNTVTFSGKSCCSVACVAARSDDLSPINNCGKDCCTSSSSHTMATCVI